MSRVTNSLLGPVEYLAIEFPDGSVSDGFGQELEWLTKEGSVRLLDFVYLKRSCAGAIQVAERDDLELLEELNDRTGRLIGREEISFVGEHLALGSSVALLVLEDLWATPLIGEIARGGGSVVEGVSI